MAAPVAAYIQLPTDSGNTGKKVRTQTRVVGADTVHEHFFIAISPRSVTGIYKFGMPLQSVQVSAHNGTSTAFFWLINPSGSTIKVALRRIEVVFGIGANTTTTTTPRIVAQRFTFTGTASGATISPAKRDSTDVAAQGSMRTAATGITVTPDQIEWTCLPSSMVGTAGWTFIPAVVNEYEPRDDDGQSIYRTGEGTVFYQPDAGGVTTDVRRFSCCGSWTEFE